MQTLVIDTNGIVKKLEQRGFIRYAENEFVLVTGGDDGEEMGADD